MQLYLKQNQKILGPAYLKAVTHNFGGPKILWRALKMLMSAPNLSDSDVISPECDLGIGTFF